MPLLEDLLDDDDEIHITNESGILDDLFNKIKTTNHISILDKLLLELVNKYTQNKIEIKFDNDGLWLNIRYELKGVYDKYNKEIHLGDTVKCRVYYGKIEGKVIEIKNKNVAVEAPSGDVFSVLGKECMLVDKTSTDKDQ